MKRNTLLILLFLAFPLTVFPQVDDGNEALRRSLQEQALKGKKLFLSIGGTQNARQQEDSVSVDSIDEELRLVKEKIAKLTKVTVSEETKPDPGENLLLPEKIFLEQDGVQPVKKQDDILWERKFTAEDQNSVFNKVAGWIDHRNDAELAHLVDSLIELDEFTPEIENVVPLIVEYAETYVNIPYEDISFEKAAIRQFVTYVHDRGSYPSNEFHCKVWDRKFIYCYKGPKFDVSEPLPFTLVDFSHRYHPPIDPYTGKKEMMSRGYSNNNRYDPKTRTWYKSGSYMHGGVDLRFNPDDPSPKVYAVFDGVVRYADYNGSFGYTVVIRHYNGAETLYAHNESLKVRSGDHVKAGDVIAIGGNTGHGSGPHLHFEVLFRGRKIDPESIINFGGGRYNTGGAGLYELFARTITVKKKKDCADARYQVHEVVVDHMMKKREIEGFLVSRAHMIP